ncbi:hypothetical protein SFUMM280S_06445 [Streptomyces fumanus]
MREAKRPKKVGSWQAVGALVAHYRRKRRLTQEQFAELANMHVDTVGSIEQGDSPSSRTAPSSSTRPSRRAGRWPS